MKLLQIDDNLAYMQELQRELLRSGAVLCDLDSTASLIEAQQKLSEAVYDAIIVDPVTLKADPFEACASLHQAASLTPILVLTADNDDLKAAEAMASGASDYLVKEQAQPPWLMRRVRYAIERAKQNGMRHEVSRPHVRSQWRATAATALSDTVAEIGTQTPGHGHRQSGPSATTVLESANENATSAQRAFSVLHVEDDPAFLRLVAKLLENNRALDFTLEQTDNLATAIQRLGTRVFDLVLLDLS